MFLKENSRVKGIYLLQRSYKVSTNLLSTGALKGQQKSDKRIIVNLTNFIKKIYLILMKVKTLWLIRQLISKKYSFP